MDLEDAQRRIQAIRWYHEFDFGSGLTAASTTPDVDDHRRVWDLIRRELDGIDFAGKTVLDIGCWDGYWSFYAEKRGAASVLATDDLSQNWGEGSGVLLAKELLRSKIELDLSRSVYRVAELGRTFDIVLCLGVYYHLFDPIYAFSQIRHCCHEGTVVVFEGDATIGIRPDTFFYDLRDQTTAIFVPTDVGLRRMLQGAYFDVTRQAWGLPPHPPSFRRRLQMVSHIRSPSEQAKHTPMRMGRLVTVCRPFSGDNPSHVLEPPFGLARYDPRFTKS